MMTSDELAVLKAEALLLASKAKTCAAHIRRSGPADLHPDPADYDQLADVIAKLANPLPC